MSYGIYKEIGKKFKNFTGNFIKNLTSQYYPTKLLIDILLVDLNELNSNSSLFPLLLLSTKKKH
jgi:hypothetical protein